jgi:hypothetical protein
VTGGPSHGGLLGAFCVMYVSAKEEELSIKHGCLDCQV